MKTTIQSKKCLDKQGVYKITNITNMKCYFGSTQSNFKKRLYQHERNLILNKHPNKHLQRAWNTDGAENFIFEVLLICKKEECLAQEQLFLTKYCDNGVNCYNFALYANSPMQGRKHTQISKEKISKSQIGRIPSQETRDKISVAATGVTKAPLTEEWKKKISKSITGTIKSEEAKIKHCQTCIKNNKVQPGNRYGNLVIIKFDSETKYKKFLWECRCDCGNIKIILGASLLNGRTKSCGCLKKTFTLGPSKNNKFNLKGVSFDKINNKYLVIVYINTKRKNIGRFESKEDAAMAYDKIVFKLYGEKAYLNYPDKLLK